jgi:hypothetical protein
MGFGTSLRCLKCGSEMERDLFSCRMVCPTCGKNWEDHVAPREEWTGRVEIDPDAPRFTVSRRGRDFLAFAEKVFRHIEDYTVKQYGDAPNDQVEEWTPEQCMRQIGKYVARFESNARGEQEKFRDLVKVAHYAQLAWLKLTRRAPPA